MKKDQPAVNPKAPGSRKSPPAAPDLKKENASLKQELAQARAQQQATADVLKAINRSKSDLSSVLQALVESAVRVCDAEKGMITRRIASVFYRAESYGFSNKFVEYVRGVPVIPERKTATGRALLEGRTIHIPDVLADPYYAFGDAQSLGDVRTIVGVPMFIDGIPAGVLALTRSEVRPFSGKEIEAVSTFADQAAIAIENARLFHEVQARTKELSESLEQQTATSQVLQVISSSPGELEPAFQTMLENATRICGAGIGVLWRYENGSYRAIARLGVTSAFAEFLDHGPVQPGSTTGLGRIARTKQTTHIVDTQAEEAYAEREPLRVATIQLAGARTLLDVPILKDGDLIGVIGIYRQEVRPFSDEQIQLVENFAKQAVIAIENARLLTELRESLERQTATSEVLRVISSSPGDLEPVFKTMLENATRICDAKFGTLFHYDGELFHRVTSVGTPAALVEFQEKRGPFKPETSIRLGRLVQTKEVYHTVDELNEPEPGPPAKYGGARSVVGVPMLKDNEVAGAIVIYRQEVRPFTEKQIELVKNFANQAVIAIENTRLLNELRESLDRQTATSEVLQIISSSPGELQPVFDTMLERATRICEATFGNLFLREGHVVRTAAVTGEPDYVALWNRNPTIDLVENPGIPIERVVRTKEVAHIPDMRTDPSYADWNPRVTALVDTAGARTFVCVPMLKGYEVIGAIAMYRQQVRPFTDKQIELVTNFAKQAVIAIENTRLLHEIRDKSHQLEIASQHKSQFLANMSHELRTPLNAILGYTELILDSIYGEPTEKMRSVLERLQANGKHLLNLINDVLDLSKIEAGQLTLDLGDYSLNDVVHTVVTAVEPLAAGKALDLTADVGKDLPTGYGDGRRLAQVLLNLVGNAIKFADQGHVTIKASTSDSMFTVAVSDTGPGISISDQAKLFQEFQQADNSITKQKGGTGLGLAISKRIIEMHGGRIWVESQVGTGSTFTFTVPIRAQREVTSDGQMHPRS